MVIRAVQAAREITDDFEIIVLDDGSHDDSVQVLEEVKCAIPQLRVIEHDQPSGYGGNVRAGIAASTKEWVFYTDGDAQYDAREIKLLVEALRPGVDVVNGWKIKRRDPLHRILIGLAYQYFVKLIFGLTIRDVDCDFRLMRRSIFDVVQLESVTGTITFEMVKKIQDAGFKFAEVPGSSLLPPIRRVAVFQLSARGAHARRIGGLVVAAGREARGQTSRKAQTARGAGQGRAEMTFDARRERHPQ